MRAVKKDAYYYSKENNAVLKAIRSEEYSISNFEQYLTKENLLKEYAKSFFDDVKDAPIVYNGVNYYYAEVDIYSISGLTEISDIC